MPSAATTGRHAVRISARVALLVALLAFLITTFTPGFAHQPPPDAGYCAKSDAAHASQPMAEPDGDTGADPGTGTEPGTEPGAEAGADDCEMPLAFAAPGTDSGGHHGPGRRTCFVSTCHHRSRPGPLVAPAVVGVTATWVTDLDTRLSVPASAHPLSGILLPPSDVLRC